MFIFDIIIFDIYIFEMYALPIDTRYDYICVST